jgi:hypothetical protein
MNLDQNRQLLRRVDVSPAEDAHWFPHNLDLAAGLISFRRVQRGDLVAAPFLDPHWDVSNFARKDIPVAALPAPRNALRPHANFIWHVGYCCSTAIAKALDATASNVSLCEPEILLRLAETRHRPCRRADPTALPAQIFRLLARTFSENGIITVKPPPAAIGILPAAARETRGKMLFLYTDCASFVLSAMRRSENRRRHVRALLGILMSDTPVPVRWSAQDIARLTDLEVAGIVWQLQIAEFRRHCVALGSRAASLDCDAFLDSPVETIEALKGFFEIPAREGDEVFDPTSAAGLRDVKRPGESIDPLERRTALQKLEPQRREELEAVVRSSYDLFWDTPRGAAPLPNALIGTDKPYVL